MASKSLKNKRKLSQYVTEYLDELASGDLTKKAMDDLHTEFLNLKKFEGLSTNFINKAYSIIHEEDQEKSFLDMVSCILHGGFGVPALGVRGLNSAQAKIAWKII